MSFNLDSTGEIYFMDAASLKPGMYVKYEQNVYVSFKRK